MNPDEIYLANFPFGGGAGMKVVRLHKLATIHSRSVVRHLGVLSPNTAAEVDDKLRTLLRL